MESIDEKSDPTARTGDVLACARLLSKAVTAIYDDNLRSFGISATQFAFLTTIGREPITRAEIARLYHLNKSTLTRDLKTTLSAGWVQEVREHANGRTKPLALTTSGKKLVLNAQQAWHHCDHVPAHRSCRVLENGALAGEKVSEPHQTTNAVLVSSTTAQIQAAALLGTDTMNALMSITDCINP